MNSVRKLCLISFLFSRAIFLVAGFSSPRGGPLHLSCTREKVTSGAQSATQNLNVRLKSRTVVRSQRDDSSNDAGATETNPIADTKFYPVKGVTLKMAFDQTYAVADASEIKSERFTCPESLDLVHRLRRNSDCVLVGKGTVVRDNCTLTVRRVDLFEGREQPARVIVDSKLQIMEDGADFSILKDGLRTIIYHSCNDDAEESSPNTPNNPNLTTVKLPKSSDNIITPRGIIQDLQSKDIHHVMLEGGPATAIQFLKEKLVDRAIIIRAPVKFIEPVSSGMTDDSLIEAGLVILGSKQCGDDTVEYWTKEGADWPTEDFESWPN